MKTFLVLAFLVSMIGSTQASTVTAKCTDGEQIDVVVKQVAQGIFKADVTVESVGDSRPTFHFNKVSLEARPHNSMGAPYVYYGKDFELSIRFDERKAPATLTVPSLGLHAEQLHCR